MKEMTYGNVRNAFSGESQAYVRYMLYSEVAEDEGFKNVSLLFDAVVFAEKIHARNLLEISPDGVEASTAPMHSGIGDTETNLDKAIHGEEFETNEMYPSYYEVAKSQEESEAMRIFNWAMRAEKEHAKLYKIARDKVEKGQDIEINLINVCSRCGYTIDEKPPEKCPICGAPQTKFKEFSQN
ncbi:rubrerythrin family protein [Methanonatronarchaeum sp. AMET-Sl]|uniref:rubrerythrin family protein n=1 Tax=Methanonatronarchaeum sp. AMET-Sl TaxID=3037654 RepID=UPI00244DC552|nr:rubrerythrin family protein [Methanonatronarchaeum sp. AMET-Sl]WGI16685.1 rubrerythrin family protein [Methanonatronarchaeum sp. AMET-Sl]